MKQTHVKQGNKCKACKGLGKVVGGSRTSQCISCKGKGYKIRKYGEDFR